MLSFFLAALALLPQQCVSDEFEPGATSIEQAFGPSIQERLLERWNPAWGRALAIVSNSDSIGLRVRAYSENGDSADMAEIVTVLHDALAVDVPADEPLRLLLHDGFEFAPRAVAEFTTCAPKIKNRTALGRELGEVARRFRIRETKVLRVMLWIDIEGRATEARLDQSSGAFDLDAAVLDVARGWSFEPAQNEGIPVPVWLRFPITLQTSGGGGPG